MRIFVLGRSEFLYNSAVLLSSSYNICGIITAAPSPEFAVTEKDFKKLADEINCPFMFTTGISEREIEFIKSTFPDICISVNWVSILRDNVLSLFPYGVLNAHFGNLPAYRGNAVINWAILRGEKSIAITIHKMLSGEVDTGPVYIKEFMDIDQHTEIGHIVEFCKSRTPILFLEVIRGIESGKLKPLEEKDIISFRCYPRLPEYSKINWNASAEEIHALIRSSSRPYRGAYSYLKINDEIKKVYIWKSRVVEINTKDIGVAGHVIKNDKLNGESWVYTGKGIIALLKVQYEGGEEFAPGYKWKSIRMHFGFDAEDELYRIYRKK